MDRPAMRPQWLELVLAWRWKACRLCCQVVRTGRWVPRITARLSSGPRCQLVVAPNRCARQSLASPHDGCAKICMTPRDHGRSRRYHIASAKYGKAPPKRTSFHVRRTESAHGLRPNKQASLMLPAHDGMPRPGVETWMPECWTVLQRHMVGNPSRTSSHAHRLVAARFVRSRMRSCLKL